MRVFERNDDENLKKSPHKLKAIKVRAPNPQAGIPCYMLYAIHVASRTVLPHADDFLAKI